MLPPFRSDGQLPPGVHSAGSWTEVEARFGGTPTRQALLVKLRAGLGNLRDAGCPWVLLDDSFTTLKGEPNDVDGCWEWEPGVDLTVLDRAFLLLDTQDRARLLGRYGMDFFVADMMEAGSGQPFSEFFQTDRDGRRRGIVKLDLSLL